MSDVANIDEAIEHADKIFVARQPIFDSRQKVVAYELLYRTSLDNTYGPGDGTSATLNVLRHAFLVLGPQLTGLRKAFINFNADLLKRRLPLVLNPKTSVVEILEEVEADKTVVEACKELKTAGYTIALDDFSPEHETPKALVDLADIIKVDFRDTNGRERRDIVATHSARTIAFLAEKVETPEEFTEAREIGYRYFQGYFFGKPVIVSSKSVPGNKVNHVRMLAEINREEMDLPALERIIKKDTYLCYALLNYINSAYFGQRESVGSIMQALVLLGEREVRKWASLVLLTFIGSDKPSEVSVTSLVRAKFCEELAGKAGLSPSELFLTGMFSLLDTLVGRPLDEILDRINVVHDIKVALTSGGNRHGDILCLVLAYERAEWRDVDLWLGKLDLERTDIPSSYGASIGWAEQIFDRRVSAGLHTG